MRAPFHSVVLLALTLAGCGQAPSAIADAPSLARSAEHGTTRRPISGSCELTFSPAPPSVPAPPPGILRQVDVGTCQISHLGRSDYRGLLDIDFAAGTQTGSRTFTAANGDQLHSTVVGTSAPSGPTTRSISATFTFTGGTGRFAGARGEAKASATANLATSSTSVVFEGWIEY